MIKGINLFFACAVVLSTAACGSSDGSSVLGLPQTEVTDSKGGNRSTQSVNELVNDLSVQDTVEGDKLILPAGTQVSVLDNNVDANGQEWVRLGLEFNDESLNLPQDVWVLASDYANAEFTTVDDEDPFDENGFEIDSLSAYARKKMTYCYRYVKLYLLEHGMVKEYLPGGSAWMAATTLPKYGFKKSGRKPSNAIVNDVCVYKGGPSGHGHIEVKTAKGWYYGYGYKAAPIKNRIFMGCFHK